jgi:hypothetical protein
MQDAVVHSNCISQHFHGMIVLTAQRQKAENDPDDQKNYRVLRK